MIGTRLQQARLCNATLHRATLSKADLTGADLTGADLSQVINLTCAQLASARVDKTTRLPDYIRLDWLTDTEFKCRDNKRRLDEP